MTESFSPTDLARELCAIYRTDAARAETLMEERLAARLAGRPAAEQIAALGRVIQELRGDGVVTPATPQAFGQDLAQPDVRLEQDVFARLYTLVLGKEIAQTDLPVSVLHERLADSLNTVFDSLNELIGVIHRTLSSQGEEIETIRAVIGSGLGEEGGLQPLESYLGQIKKSFLVVHQAFKEAAQSKVMQILSELSPDRMAAESSGSGLGFGPFRKAELFEAYQERFKQCLDWFTAGRFQEEFLREFEKRCQQLSK
jgi:hypothetical protein